MTDTHAKNKNVPSPGESIRDTFVLQLGDFEVPKGSLTAIVGRVGSGKSMVLLSLLGELKPRAGEVRVCDSIGYVPQRAVIVSGTQPGISGTILGTATEHAQQPARASLSPVTELFCSPPASGTIRENVIFGRPIDAVRFDYCISACDLHHDLESFPRGTLGIGALSRHTPFFRMRCHCHSKLGVPLFLVSQLL